MAPGILRPKNLVTAEFLFLLFILAVTAVLYFRGDPPPPGTLSAKARILELKDDTELKAGWLKTGGQEMVVRILSGPFRNREVDVANLLVGNLMSDRYVRVGDRIILHLTINDGKIAGAKLIDYDRQYWHGALFLLFVVLLLIFSRLTGLKALVAFVFTAMVMTKAGIPMIIEGFDPLGVCLVLSLIFGVTTILLVGGFSIRSGAAIAGMLTGLGLSTVLVSLVGKEMHLSTSLSEHAITLFYSGQAHLDITRILFGAVILGASGAMVDIGMAVATAVGQVAKANPAIGVKRLISAGMHVGRATLGTMVTTLLLAYAGCSIFLFLAFAANETHMGRILNFNGVTAEILRTLCGSIGLVLIAPLTAVIAGIAYHRILKTDTHRALPKDNGIPPAATSVVKHRIFCNRDTAWAAVVMLFTIGVLWAPGAQSDGDATPVTAEVVRTVDDLQRLGPMDIGRQELTLRILTPPYKGHEIDIVNNLVGHVLTDRYYRAGDNALVMLDIQDRVIHGARMVEHDRRPWQTALLIFFAGLLVCFARATGIRAFISFFFSLVVLFKCFFPAIINGTNPLGLCIAFAILFGMVTLLLVGGINVRSAAAIIGFTIGILLTAGLTAWSAGGMYLRGITSDWAVFLLQTGHPGLDLTAILVGSIIIGASGAMVDVAVSIATCVREVSRANPTLGFLKLTRSGFELGCAELGTMTSTLLLAYMGVNIFLLMLYAAKATPMAVILNNGVISHEILRALAGSIGMVLTAPVTAIVAGIFYRPRMTADNSTL